MTQGHPHNAAERAGSEGGEERDPESSPKAKLGAIQADDLARHANRAGLATRWLRLPRFDGQG